MEHRRGRRWPINLMVLIDVDHSESLYLGRLLDLSYDGASIEIKGRNLSPGNILMIWLPGMRSPVQALTVRTQGSSAGLLWTEYSTRVMALIEEAHPAISTTGYIKPAVDQ